jgi:twitching motility protein PilI
MNPPPSAEPQLPEGLSSQRESYSRHLESRLRNQASSGEEPVRLAVRIGAASILTDMTHVSEIIPTPALTPVPWTKPWFRGLCNVRGRVVGVIDLPEFSGAPALPMDQAQQLIVLGETLKVQAGILISRAYGLRKLSSMQSLDLSGNDHLPWEIARYTDIHGDILTEIDIARLVDQDAFRYIGL